METRISLLDPPHLATHWCGNILERSEYINIIIFFLSSGLMPATNSSRTKLGSEIKTITTSISSSKLRKHLYSSCDLWFFWNTIYNHTKNQGGFIYFVWVFHNCISAISWKNSKIRCLCFAGMLRDGKLSLSDHMVLKIWGNPSLCLVIFSDQNYPLLLTINSS